mmetsp:Transcript_63465/g.175935  ORF Transcript_63465/g.175935 Transcript_63465/m.175935 type:complete len:265 (+) Transcript_63465:406-1200(+)
MGRSPPAHSKMRSPARSRGFCGSSCHLSLMSSDISRDDSAMVPSALLGNGQTLLLAFMSLVNSGRATSISNGDSAPLSGGRTAAIAAANASCKCHRAAATCAAKALPAFTSSIKPRPEWASKSAGGFGMVTAFKAFAPPTTPSFDVLAQTPTARLPRALLGLILDQSSRNQARASVLPLAMDPRALFKGTRQLATALDPINPGLQRSNSSALPPSNTAHTAMLRSVRSCLFPFMRIFLVSDFQYVKLFIRNFSFKRSSPKSWNT